MIKKIIIARTDSIGDVMLTLPLCGWLKQQIPGLYIAFLGRGYTEAVIRCCRHVDHFINADQATRSAEDNLSDVLSAQDADAIVHVFPDARIMKAAYRAKIPIRIATSGRWSSWLYCNKRAFFSRKKSALHEAQLNLKLLEPLGLKTSASLQVLGGLYGFGPRAVVSTDVESRLNGSKKRVILHPFSKGSAVEWGVEKFGQLSYLLAAENFQVVVCGTSDDDKKLQPHLHSFHEETVNLCGSMTLDEYISFIDSSFALVAASTGPLHIAAACGIRAIGLYSPQRPIHPGRWQPVGNHAAFIVAASHPENQAYLDIAPGEVLKLLTTP